MREIKFRAWDKTRKEFLSGGEVLIAITKGSNPKSNPIYLDILKDPNFYKERFVLQQYTGLKDKNGKEIYEGDIVANYNCRGEIHAKGTVTYSTSFNIGCNGYEYDQSICGFHCGDECLTDSMIFNDVFIIGNIYENPELLEVAQ